MGCHLCGLKCVIWRVGLAAGAGQRVRLMEMMLVSYVDTLDLDSGLEYARRKPAERV